MPIGDLITGVKGLNVEKLFKRILAKGLWQEIKNRLDLPADLTEAQLVQQILGLAN